MLGRKSLAVSAVMVGLVVNACVSYSTPAETPAWTLETMAVNYEVPPGEGDDKVVGVKVGEMRVALATAERYEAAVQSYNDIVGIANVVIERARVEEGKVAQNKKAGQWNSVVAGVSMGVVGVMVGYLISIVRWR